MATNASTWFYREPEHDAYLLEERVNHTFWHNRVMDMHLDCVSAEPPFRMVGEWRGMTVTIEWEPQAYFVLTAQPNDDGNLLIIGVKEILGLNPTISYVDPKGNMIAEWHVKEEANRIKEIQGNPNFKQVKRYK